MRPQKKDFKTSTGKYMTKLILSEYRNKNKHLLTTSFTECQILILTEFHLTQSIKEVSSLSNLLSPFRYVNVGDSICVAKHQLLETLDRKIAMKIIMFYFENEAKE